MIDQRTQEWAKRARAHLLGSDGVVGGAAEVIFEKGKGIILTDVEGKEYIDISSFVQACNLGYDNTEIIDAMTEQMHKLHFGYSAGAYNYNATPGIELAEELAKVAYKNINHFMFTTGGTESVEWAIRLAKSYWYAKGKATKYKVICLTNGYHGMGSLSGSLIGAPAARLPYGLEFPGIVRVPSYYCYHCLLGREYPSCNLACVKHLEVIIQEEGEDSIAAFIAEPVHGFGGAIAPPPEYFPMVRKICTEHNVLFIADEVITGFCRTGKMFVLEHWNVEPDIMTLAKGMTGAYAALGAVGFSDEIYSTLLGSHFALGSTGPSALAAVAGAETALNIYIRDRIAENVAKVGKHAKERLINEFLPLPHVGDISGLGLLLGIEIVADKVTKRRFPSERDIMDSVVRRQCYEQGLFPRFYRSMHHDRLSFSPPLIITEAEIDKALDILYPIIAGVK